MKTTLLLTLLTTLTVSAATDKLQIIYGEDNRQDISEVRDWKVRKVAKSVAARVQTRMLLVQDKQFSFDFVPALSDRWGAMVCEDEKFADQPTISDCSGFLVGDDLLATAGHCVADYPGEFKNENSHACREFSWMFDYEAVNGKVEVEGLDVKNLYGCKEIVHAVMNDKTDFALIRLDRKVTDREPLKVRTSGKINDKQDIFVVGYPSGLPLKYAGGAQVFGNKTKDYFSTNLDTFGGNSGSPVFNADTYEVEGILVRGRTDYVDSEKDGKFCRRVNTCNERRGNCLVQDEEIDGEHVNRLDKIAKHL